MVEDLQLFKEISKSAEFHSVLMTTFCIDFHHFENQVLRFFKQKGIVNVNILVDERMLNESLGFATGKLQYVNSNYNVDSIFNKSVFHPKISFFAGENEVMLMQGTGNITPGGHGKNHELFSVLYATNEEPQQLNLIGEAWSYLKDLSKNLKGISQDKINWITDNSPLLLNTNFEKHRFVELNDFTEIALLYNETSGIFRQLVDLLPAAEIKNITVVSPFYDENGKLLIELLAQFTNAKLDVFLSDRNCVHPHKMDENEKINFFNWEVTARAEKKFKSYSRILHSKVFIFESDNFQYCLLGSANATIAAFGTMNSRGVNDEFGILYKSNKIKFKEVLGIEGVVEKVKPRVIDHHEIGPELKQNHVNYSFKISSADYNSGIITVYLEKFVANAMIFYKVFNNCGEMLFEEEINCRSNKIEIKILPNKSQNVISYIQLFNEDEAHVSNKYLINNVSDLWNTNPSKENRKLLRLTTLIETGEINTIDIIDFLNQIHSAKEDNKQINANTGSGNSDKDKKEKDLDAHLSYEEAVSKNHDFKTNTFISSNHHSVKIWDAIELFIKNYALETEEEDSDDEEEADASEGRLRKPKEKPKEIIIYNSQNVLEKKRKAILRFLSNYHLTINRITRQDDSELGITDLSLFLIVMHQLNDVTTKKVYLKKEDTEEILFKIEGSISTTDNYSGAVLNLLGAFFTMSLKSKWVTSNDEYILQKMAHYKALGCTNALFALAIIYNRYGELEKFEGWIEVMAYNSLKVFGLPAANYEEVLQNLFKEIYVDDLSLNTLVNTIKGWIKSYCGNVLRPEIYYNRKTGYCLIKRYIPPNKPRFIKISRPGFAYDITESDFISHELFDLHTECWFKSRQRL